MAPLRDLGSPTSDSTPALYPEQGLAPPLPLSPARTGQYRLPTERRPAGRPHRSPYANHTPGFSLTRLREARRAFRPPAISAILTAMSLRVPGRQGKHRHAINSNTSDLTIWLGRHPTARAASTAVLVPLLKIRMSSSMSSPWHLSTKRRVASGRLAGSDTPLYLIKPAGVFSETFRAGID